MFFYEIGSSIKKCLWHNHNNLLYRGMADSNGSTQPMDWVSFDSDTLRATVQGLPGKGDISLPVDANMVVEFLSR